MVVEKAAKSQIQDIDKRKFLVPSDLTGMAKLIIYCDACIFICKFHLTVVERM